MGNSADSLDEFEAVSKTQGSKTELTPLEVNGITAVTIGTLVWTVATLVMVLMRDQLINIGIAGIILGLLGMRYTKRRAARIQRAKASN